MRIKLLAACLIANSLALFSCHQPREIFTAETVFVSDSVRAGNLAITQDGRLFVSINPLLAPQTKVYELKQSNRAIPYPSDNYVVGDSSIIKEIIGIRTDNNDNLWMLDMDKNHFVVWDTRNEKLKDIIPIPDSVTRENSFLQDFIIDQKNNRVVIADMTIATDSQPAAPAFIVMDLATGKTERMAENHLALLPDNLGGMGLNPIAIDPEFNWIYFGALNGTTLYRVPAFNFGDEDLLIASIEEFGPKPYSDGIAVDAYQNVYVTNITDQAIGVASDGIYRNIALLPDGQSWPDGLYISDDGYVYATISQLDRTPMLGNGTDQSQAPYMIVRTELIETEE